MKKTFWKLSFFLLMAVVSVNFVSCGDDDDDAPTENNSGNGKNSGGEDNGNPEDTGSAMTPSQQKQYLETVGKEFMEKTAASDFKDYADFTKYCNDTYIKNYNWNTVGEWARDCFKACLTMTLDKEETNVPYESEYSKTIYKYYYKNYDALFLASNFCSHFTANNGTWIRSDAKDLQFIFTDQNGKQCVLKLETSGKVARVHAGILKKSDRDGGYQYIDNKHVYTYEYYYDSYNCTIGLPEQITVSLTLDGKQLVNCTVKTDLSSITNEEFDISKDKLNLSVLTEFSNGYKANVSQIAYSGNKTVSVNCAISKNNTSLVTMKVTSDVSGLPSVNASEISNKEVNMDNANANNAKAEIDIIGKLQIKGTISDVRKAVNYFENAKNNNDNEAQFKSYINQANSLVDLSLYYDGNSTKQASLKLEPFAKQKWNGYTYWICEPVIVFYDGSSYSTLSAFFNENDFQSLISSFKSLANQYADLVSTKIKW